MKKWTKLGIGLLCATLIAFGVRSISGVSNADEASQTVTGTVKTIDAAHGEVTVTTADGTQKTVPLSKTVWVFLDDHKAHMSDIGTGFKVDLILNGKKQAAYIKAISITVTDKTGSTQAPAGTAAPATPAASAAPTTPAAPAAGSSPAASPAPAQSAAPSAAAQTAAPWDTLHIKIEGNGFTMDIHDKGDHNNGMSMIKMKPKGHDGLFLKGDEAEHWIRTLLAGIDLKSPNAQQQISAAFTNWFELNGITLNVNIEVEAKPAAAAAAPSSAPVAASGTPAAPASTPAASVNTPAAPASAPAAPATAPAAPAVKAQITISQNNDGDDDEQDEDDNENKQEHDKQDKDNRVKVQIKANEHNHKDHEDNGKHKGKDDKDD